MGKEFTHLAKIYGIPCYFNEENMEVQGTNKFYDLLIEIRVYLEEMLPLGDGYYITKIKELKKPIEGQISID